MNTVMKFGVTGNCLTWVADQLLAYQGRGCSVEEIRM